MRSTLAGILVCHLDDEGNRVADLQVGKFLAVVPVELLGTLAAAHRCREGDGFFRATIHPVSDRGGADPVVVLRTHREVERAAEQCVEVRLGRGQLDARDLVGRHLEEVARAGEFETMVTLGPREAVAARSRGDLGKSERATVGTDFERQVVGTVTMQRRLADRGVERELPANPGFLRGC